ncbi:MAG: hypothetical protein ACM3H7_00200 [Acidobacteriaceae bacterium]
MKPVQIDVFFPIPEGWGMCSSCELIMSQADLGGYPQGRDLDEYPPEWQEDLRQLSATIFALSERFSNAVLIRIWDPRSLQGLLKSIRHGVRRYPTFLVSGQKKYTGWDTRQIEQDIQSQIESSNSAI